MVLAVQNVAGNFGLTVDRSFMKGVLLPDGRSGSFGFEGGDPVFGAAEQAVAGRPVRGLQDDDEAGALLRGPGPVARLDLLDEAGRSRIEGLREEIPPETLVDPPGLVRGGIDRDEK